MGEIIQYYPGWLNIILRVIIRRRGRQKRENQREGSVERTQLNVAGFEDRGMGPQDKEYGWSFKSGKGKRQILSLELPQGT